MKLQPDTEQVADPFFAAVRRRHPDVDLVVLPPVPPRPAEADPVPDDVVASTLVRTATAAEQLWATIVPESTERPGARLAYGSRPDSIRAVARIVTHRDDGFEVLVSLRHQLEAHGWEIRRPPGEVERITGVLEGLDVAASYAEEAGVLIFTLSSESQQVGNARARALVRSQAGGA